AIAVWAHTPSAHQIPSQWTDGVSLRCHEYALSLSQVLSIANQGTVSPPYSFACCPRGEQSDTNHSCSAETSRQIPASSLRPALQHQKKGPIPSKQMRVPPGKSLLMPIGAARRTSGGPSRENRRYRQWRYKCAGAKSRS